MVRRLEGTLKRFKSNLDFPDDWTLFAVVRHCIDCGGGQQLAVNLNSKALICLLHFLSFLKIFSVFVQMCIKCNIISCRT